jgi:CysZ protein
MAMFRIIGLALSDLSNPRVLGIMLQALLIALLIFAGLAGIVFWLLAGADPCDAFGISSCRLDAGLGGLGALTISLLAAWFLLPAVAIAVITTFTDRIARAVEQRHYPDAAKEAQAIGLIRGAALGARSATRLILFNLAALPFYLLLLVTGVGPFVLFVIVNGLAFGRDIGELAAARHGDHASRGAWLRSTRGEQGLIGTLTSVLFLVPFANLVAPAIGAAAGIHLFNRSFWTMNAGDHIDSKRSKKDR